MTQKPVAVISFTKNEAEIMIERLIQLDEDMLEELYEDSDTKMDIAAGAAYALAVTEQFQSNNFVVSLDIPEAAEILAESLEGSTYFGAEQMALESGEHSRQKSSAMKRAAQSAADKIEPHLGRPITVAPR
jgi:hypothetical protein